jgi:hypothetical protein
MEQPFRLLELSGNEFRSRKIGSRLCRILIESILYLLKCAPRRSSGTMTNSRTVTLTSRRPACGHKKTEPRMGLARSVRSTG